MASEFDSSNVIEIRDAYKRYSSNNVVLQGLNMTVKKGTIYGLLGSSGCGKTTLLNCITGISALDAGMITVRCNDRRKMGHMPQETALMETFTVSELLHYFGKVYGMDRHTVEKRAKELLQLVNLPPNEFYHLYITSLSGGQLRRISLLVALIQDPELLILDEPTVGLDPITRFSIWQYLLSETEQQNKTILITTHYIEEARQSHTIGLMRKGVLLAEDPPAKLLIDYKCPSLEEVFFLLSREQAGSTSEIMLYPTVKPPARPFSSDTSYLNLHRLAAQIQKNYYWVQRNLWMIAYILLVPGMMSFLFCSAYSNDLRGLHIATITEELCTNINSSVEPTCSKDSKISCIYLQRMKNKGYIINEYPDLASGQDALSRGHALALLYFNHNYTAALLDLVSSSIILPPGPETLESCELQVTLDMTEMFKAAQIKLDVRMMYLDIRRELVESCGNDPRTIEELLRISEPIYGSRRPDFTHSAIPGFLIPFVFYLAATYTSTAIGMEQSSGILRRSLVSGLTKLEINLAHTVIQLAVLAVQNCQMMFMIYVVYNNPMKGSILAALTFVIMTELQGMLYGSFLASLIKQDANLTNAVVGTMLALFLTSGIMWPVEGMVPGLKSVIQFSPWYLAVETYRSISIRGWGFDNRSVLLAFYYNAATILVMVVANIISAKMNRIS